MRAQKKLFSIHEANNNETNIHDPLTLALLLAGHNKDIWLINMVTIWAQKKLGVFFGFSQSFLKHSKEGKTYG